ncbi:hypothetical protein R1X32_07155 (plasmid) [Rhodococcus opacus]|uniref:thiolase family protein n=1 Tax=Rhodococcus opacus TaxID=37919 RepID=UPI0034D1D056
MERKSILTRIRGDLTAESLAALKHVFTEEGRVTTGNSSQISEGGPSTSGRRPVLRRARAAFSRSRRGPGRSRS